jgi:hypothetical protein
MEYGVQNGSERVGEAAAVSPRVKHYTATRHPHIEQFGDIVNKGPHARSLGINEREDDRGWILANAFFGLLPRMVFPDILVKCKRKLGLFG